MLTLLQVLACLVWGLSREYKALGQKEQNTKEVGERKKKESLSVFFELGFDFHFEFGK